MTDTELNHALALAHGYTYAGPFRGKEMYHPPGVRTAVTPLPAYTEDWNLLLPALEGAGLVETLVQTLRAGRADIRQSLCGALLATLQKDAAESDHGCP